MVHDCHAGLEAEPSAVARNKRKATVEIRKNTAPGFMPLDPYGLLLIVQSSH